MPGMSNSVYGGYQLSQLLYSTDISDVYESFHPESSIKLAIKFVRKDNASKDQIQNEYNILRGIKCEYITPIFGVIFEVPDIYYCAFVMKLAVGGNGSDFIRNNWPVGEEVAAQIMHAGLMALKYLHSRGICHRDIKLDNFLLMDENASELDIVLNDFGHSAHFNPGEKFTEYNIGNYKYNAPEIHKEIPYDETVDIWSLGVVMYRILGGYNPFQRAEKTETIQAIINSEYNFNNAIWNGISQSAKYLIISMLQVDPSKRITIDQALASKWFEDNYIEHNKQSNRLRRDLDLMDMPENQLILYANSMEDDDYIPNSF